MFEKRQTKVAAIGDPDILFILQSAGVDVFAARQEAEALQAISEIREKGFGLCFIQENFYSLALRRKEKREKKIETVFVPLRDFRQEIDFIQDVMKEMTVKATGSDMLLRRNR
ncbi:MAG: V-type ATP synthase subunit F [Candidatus Aminicenantales bacterium]